MVPASMLELFLSSLEKLVANVAGQPDLAHVVTDAVDPLLLEGVECDGWAVQAPVCVLRIAFVVQV